MTADTISRQQLEQVFVGFDAVIVEINDDVADQDTGRCGGTATRHSHHQKTAVAVFKTVVGNAYRLRCDAEVPTLQASMLEESGSDAPRDFRRDDKPEA